MQASKKWNVGDVILDLYKVTGTLGEGGFGKVYKVRHQGWQIDLAVKSPKAEIVEAAGGIENFEQEAETWVNLGLHPHTVSCYYVRRIESNPLVFAEYVAGRSLQDWIENRQLYKGGVSASLKRILDIAIQFAWGLHYAHEQGLIHQDVKPANTMMTPDGVAKVTDFGLANARTMAAVLDQTEKSGSFESEQNTVVVSGNGAMTPAYCSPEQANQQIITRRSDLWSWALSVLEMFQGERTWPIGTIAAQVLESYLQTGTEDPQLPQMPESVAQLLRRCFEYDADERPHNLLAVANELQEIYQLLIGEAYLRVQPKAAKDIADSLNNRAVSLLDLGRRQEALQLWEQALRVQPRHPESTYNRGLILWRMSKITDTILVTELEAVRKSNPEDWLGDYLLGLVHLERDDCQAAIKILEGIQQKGKQQQDVKAALALARRRFPQSKRLLHSFAGDTKRVNSVCITPDGRYVLSGKHDGTLELWEVETGCCRTWEGHLREGVKLVCISSDSRYAISLSNLTLKLWHLTTGQELCTFEVNPPTTYDLISPNGDFALSGNRLLTLRDVTTGLCLYTFARGGSAVCISPDGRYALSVDGRPLLWKMATGRCVRSFEGHTRNVNSVIFSPDGQYLLSGSADNTLKLWEIETGCCVRTFKGHTSGVNSVVFSPDGRYALSASHWTLRLWDIATGRCLRTFATKKVNSVCLSPDGHYGVSGGEGLTLWSVNGTKTPYVASMMLCQVQSAEVMLSARQIYEQELAQARLAWEQGDALAATQHIRKARSQSGYSRDKEAFNVWAKLYLCLPRQAFLGAWERATFTGHTSYVNSVVFSSDSQLALSGSSDNTLKLWDVATGRCLRTFEEYFQGKVSSVCLSLDGGYVLSGSYEGTLKLWDVATGICLRTFGGNTAGISSVCISPDGRYALSGSYDGFLSVWEISTGFCLHSFRGHKAGVNSVCMNLDGRYALSGAGEQGNRRESPTQHSLNRGSDKTLKLWDIATGRCIRTFAGHTSGVTSVCISPDRQYALSGSYDKTLKLWEVKTGSCLHTFEGHQEGVTSVCISPDGRYALSGSWDSTAKLWEIETGRCLHTFHGHTSVVKSVCLSPDGRFALSGSHDGECKLWVLDWELEDKLSTDWDQGARVYLEAFLTLHTPYAATLANRPVPRNLPQLISELDEPTKQVYGSLVLLLVISWAGTAMLAGNVVTWIMGMCLIGLAAIRSLSVALTVAYEASVRTIRGTVVEKILKIGAGGSLSPGINISQTGSNDQLWKHLKTKFGSILAVVIPLETVALGFSLGRGFHLGFWHPHVIWAVLATGLPLAWMIHSPSSSFMHWKALGKVAISILAAATLLS